MIAADTSAWIDYAKGAETDAARALESAIIAGRLVMPCPVLFEILSSPTLTSPARQLISDIPRLEMLEGYWEKAGALRAAVIKKGLKARAMDCLIAQACIDHGVALIAVDRDFRHFVKHGLGLVPV